MVCIRKSVGVFFAKFRLCLGIYTGILGCIVKLPEEVCASHTKCVGENKKSFTTQVVRRSAAHWLNFKNFKKILITFSANNNKNNFI